MFSHLSPSDHDHAVLRLLASIVTRALVLRQLDDLIDIDDFLDNFVDRRRIFNDFVG